MIAFLEEKAVAWPSGEPMRRSAAVRHIGDLLGELFTNYQLPTASPLPVEIHTGVETNTSRLSGMSAAKRPGDDPVQRLVMSDGGGRLSVLPSGSNSVVEC